MVKLRLGTSFPDRFVYDSYLASGITSHVFSGTFKIKNKEIRVAVKWLPKKYGIKEYVVTQYIKRKLNVLLPKERFYRNSRSSLLGHSPHGLRLPHNILLPIMTFSEISLGDITSSVEENVKFIIKTLNSSQGPRVTRKGTFSKHGKGMVLLFPLMETDLRFPIVGTTISSVGQDIKTGLNILNNIQVMHKDIYPRNILIKDGKCYIGDLGGAIISKEEKPYSNLDIEYMVKRLLREVTIYDNNKSRSRRHRL